MLKQVRQLWFPFLIILTTGVVFSSLLPYFPIDETRYLSVAWEMKLHSSFIVPLENALPYSHKPPLLFWLLNLNWLLFGVNELTLRFIPLFFSLLNVTLVYRIALKLWDDERIARYAAIILASTLSYLLWSVLIMFDVVLTFWVLLALYGVLSASRRKGLAPWAIAGAALGGGLLTKGPVVFVYVLPSALLAFLWIPKEKFSRRWYGGLALSVLLGIVIILLWLVPAALTGGEHYRNAILWGQTVNRMANAFAHKRPIWWYLPWIPALLFPWVFLVPAWRRCSRGKGDLGIRFLLIWIVSCVVIFSLISSKQVHYLIPVLPAFSLLMARNLDNLSESEKNGSWRFAVGAFYSVAGVALLVLSWLKMGKVFDQIGPWGVRGMGLGLLATGVAVLLLHRSQLPRLIHLTALSSLGVLAITAVTGGALFGRYELHPIAQEVRTIQQAGYTVLHYGKYHDQYQFVGRLSQPLVPVHTIEGINSYLATHDKVALITYEPPVAEISSGDVYFRQPFRSRQVVLWNKKGISEYLKQQEKNEASRRAPRPREEAAPEEM